MGYGNYRLPDGREAGYNVTATCDQADCSVEIDRGLSYLCGRNPDGHRDPGDYGCGNYYCPEHQYDHGCAECEVCPVCDGDPAWPERCVGCDNTGMVGSAFDAEYA